MYSKNTSQTIRKQNYARYEKLVRQGYSIADDKSSSSLYAVDTDPYGRTYYTKPLGESVKRDPMTGRQYTQEEWAIKDFIVDNKSQLIVKVSADLVVGKGAEIEIKDSDEYTEDQKVWLEDIVKYNNLSTLLYEGALQNSSKGDIYYEVTIDDNGKFKFIEVDAYYVDIEHEHKEVEEYEITYEFEITDHHKTLLGANRDKVASYVQKKEYYKDRIVYSLLELKGNNWVNVPLKRNPDNFKLFDKTVKFKHMKSFMSLEPVKEVTYPVNAYFIVEYTGIDEPLIIHWPNYRMFDVYGVSDVGTIEGLQNALNNRQTQLNDILDKHADPSMYGPDSYLDSYGNLEMSGGGSRYFPIVDGMTPPGYMTWQGHITETHEEIKRIYKSIFENTEISPALLGTDTGGIESGRALMYKLMRSLSMAARKSVYMQQAVNNLCRVTQKMKTVWIDGNGVDNPDTYTPPIFDNLFEVCVNVKSAIPTDRTELIEDVSKLIDKKLLSQGTAIRIISKLFDEVDADEEIAELLLAANEAYDREKELRKADTPDYLKADPENDNSKKDNMADSPEEEDDD